METYKSYILTVVISLVLCRLISSLFYEYWIVCTASVINNYAFMYRKGHGSVNFYNRHTEKWRKAWEDADYREYVISYSATQHLCRNAFWSIALAVVSLSLIYYFDIEWKDCSVIGVAILTVGLLMWLSHPSHSVIAQLRAQNEGIPPIAMRQIESFIRCKIFPY